MSVLAFNDPYHDSSFCLLDVKGHQHFEMERFTRQKLDRLSPLIGALELLGDQLPGILPECRAIGVVEGDFLAPLFRRIIMAKARGRTDPGPLVDALLTVLAADLVRTLPDEPAGHTQAGSLLPYRAGFRALLRHALRPEVRVAILGHHHCHAANAFYSSPFDTARSITLDGGGYDFLDGEGGPRRLVYGSVFDGSGGGLTPVSWVENLSIGGAWARVTREVFGLNFGEEGTVMAMAAYGDPAHFSAALDAPWIWQPHEALESKTGAAAYARQVKTLCAGLRTEQDRFDLAATLQQQTEFKVFAMLRDGMDTGLRDLCLSGGVFLNCLIAGKVQSWFPWIERVFLPPAPYDGGLSIGAAQVLWHEVLGEPRGVPCLTPFAQGPAYSTLAILAACRSRRVSLEPAGPAGIAALLASGKIGAVFAGAAESGRRALGHRSILADPRVMSSRTRINDDIKHRADFRPLAPMVLAERVHDWFVCSPGFASPYMSFAVRVRDDKGAEIPAIMHRDRTARVQTVHAGLTPGLHALLTDWEALTGVPVLLNTSFNDNEPIVQTPDQALECYGRTPLDFLWFADAGMVAVKG